VGNYQYQTTYTVYANMYGFNNTAVSGTGFNVANPDIKWEVANTLNIGADAGLFNNPAQRHLRLLFQADEEHPHAAQSTGNLWWRDSGLQYRFRPEQRVGGKHLL